MESGLPNGAKRVGKGLDSGAVGCLIYWCHWPAGEQSKKQIWKRTKLS